MFIGHFAVGFAAKRAAPRTNLGWLMAAPLLLDILWPLFLVLGWERVRIDPGNTAVTPLAFDAYPWSHSLVMTLVWAGAFAGLYWWRARYRPGAVAIFVGVASHWVLDVATHRPDMPLWPGHSPLLGLGLWNSVAGTYIVESLMFAAGVWLYAGTTRARDRIGAWALWTYVALLALTYFTSASTPPPSVQALAWTSFIGWLMPLWAGWADRHRTVTLPAAGPPPSAP